MDASGISSHSSLLEPYEDNTIPYRITPPPPIKLEDGPKYKVVAFLNCKIVSNKLYYMVNWLGYSLNERTWEPMTRIWRMLELFLKTSIINIWTNQRVDRQYLLFI